ncbi:MAG: hypothetical protein IPL26_22865 [Leptospiraceae bacterium]|nr:hypothetical protein [Leptospiraceae bacterium]
MDSNHNWTKTGIITYYVPYYAQLGFLLAIGILMKTLSIFKAKVIGKKVSRGQQIGIAQDISKLYNTGKRMLAHIHLQIESIDPMILIQ